MSSPPKPFHIAIIGGGIGGLFAALSLHHHCLPNQVQISVYEQASEFKEIGAGVGLAVNAARLVHAIGLGNALNAVAGFRNGTWIDFRRSDNGESIISIPTNDSETIRQAPVARTDLLDLLRLAIEERCAATLHTKKRFEKVTDNGDHVTIGFADSTEAKANVVIGCDGIHSGVRGQFYDDRPIYSGQIAYRAVIPIQQVWDWWPFKSYSAMWCGKGRHFLTFPISSNKALNIVAFANAKAKDAENVAESWVSTCDIGDVREDYTGFEPHVQRLINLMPDRPSKWRINDREPLGQWSYMNGKVLLLGDAAHAMLPHLGAGAGQAVEDGWILGRVLSEMLQGHPCLPSLNACGIIYQKVRRPRAQKVQNTSRHQGATYDMQTEDLINKDYEQCIPIIADGLRDRMKFVWEVDLNKTYEETRDRSETSGH